MSSVNSQSKKKTLMVISKRYKGHKLNLGEKLSKTSKEFTEVKNSFCETLEKNIDARFPKDSTDVAVAFHVLAFKSLSALSPDERKQFGEREMGILLNHYGEEITNDGTTSAAVVDSAMCLEEWSLLKDIIVQQRYPIDKAASLWKLV